MSLYVPCHKGTGTVFHSTPFHPPAPALTSILPLLECSESCGEEGGVNKDGPLRDELLVSSSQLFGSVI